jgi:hypothetical protein
MTARTSTDLKTNLFQDGQPKGSVNPLKIRDLIDSVKLPYMGVYISTPAETSIAVAGTAVKLTGTTTVTHQSADMDDNSVSNRIRYTGIPTRHFHVVAQATMSLASGTNQNIGIQVYHWDDSAGTGALLAHSEARATIAGIAEFQITSHADAMLDTNDYIEIWVANETSTNNVTGELGYMFAMGMMT